MGKKIFYDQDARQRVLSGAEILYNAVKTTMGPKGRNVVINKGFGAPTVTHDGVTVAKSIDITEDDETLGYKTGIDLIKEAASKMNDVAGDGTTTVTVLTYHILNEANKLIAAGHNPMQLKKGLDSVSEQVIKYIDEVSKDITEDKNKVKQVATISAGDEEIGKLITDVMQKVGKDASVTVEEGQGLEMHAEITEGFTFDRGFVSPYMMTDQARQEAVYKSPAILLYTGNISNAQEIIAFAERVAKAGKKDLFIVAENIKDEALTVLVLNKLKGAFNTVAVQSPGFGDSKKEIMQDIATLIGGNVVDPDQGDTLESVSLEALGTAAKVIIEKDKTTIVKGAGKAVDVSRRVENIRSQVETVKSDYDKDALRKRASALESKVAIIKVGGASQTEIEEKKFRVDDAVAAVKAALEDGIVPGGGITLLNAVQKVSRKNTKDDAFTAGEKILLSALQKPFKTLMDNAELTPEEWIGLIMKGEAGMGVDVSKESTELVDMLKAGIVDPAAVTRDAVQNAVSIAGTAMTMGALVVDEPVKDQQPQQQMMM